MDNIVHESEHLERVAAPPPSSWRRLSDEKVVWLPWTGSYCKRSWRVIKEWFAAAVKILTEIKWTFFELSSQHSIGTSMLDVLMQTFCTPSEIL